MPDDEMLDRMSDMGKGGGDKLAEILNPKAGGEVGKVRRKLDALWNAGQAAVPDSSLEKMQARNAALRLSKGIKPRRADDPGTGE